jgi:hypothetical protein
MGGRGKSKNGNKTGAVEDREGRFMQACRKIRFKYEEEEWTRNVKG